MEKQILSKSRFHEVIALSDTEIGKIVFSDQFSFVEVNTGINLFPDAFLYKIVSFCSVNSLALYLIFTISFELLSLTLATSFFLQLTNIKTRIISLSIGLNKCINKITLCLLYL